MNNAYIFYLRSEDWKERRKELMAEAEGLCSECGGKATQLHHLNYKNLGFEILGADVVALCSSCHKEIHIMHGHVSEYGEYKAYG